MSVWYAIPSARPAAEVQVCVEAWRSMGYKVALLRDEGCFDVEADLLSSILPYPGYATAVNELARLILASDPEADWIVTGGDDTFPDPVKRANEIAEECREYFGWTFGVMQPTGDRFAGGSIDRIAGSPWIGREFCERMYGGNGPLYSGYDHMFVDEELLCVAERLGVYWRRPDLVQRHDHFMRASKDLNSPAVKRDPPPHLVRWNTPEHWRKSEALFKNRKATGFPGHEPLPVEVFA